MVGFPGQATVLVAVERQAEEVLHVDEQDDHHASLRVGGPFDGESDSPVVRFVVGVRVGRVVWRGDDFAQAEVAGRVTCRATVSVEQGGAMGAIAQCAAGRSAALPSSRSHVGLRRADGWIVDCVFGSIVRFAIIVGPEVTHIGSHARRRGVWWDHHDGSWTLCWGLIRWCLRRVSRGCKAAFERIGAGAGPGASHTV